MRILLIEDAEALAEAVAEHLEADRHRVDWFASLDEARAAIRTQVYDLVLLDLSLPDGEGLTLLRELRAMAQYTPVIITTARDKISDRIAGLNLGADDYVIKPFDLGELSARILTVTRRQLANASAVVSRGGITFDLQARTTHRDGQPIQLTATEWALVECLLRKGSEVVSRSRLEEAIYVFGNEVESNAIEAHISRLRSKLGRQAIVTHRGLGYSLAR